MRTFSIMLLLFVSLLGMGAFEVKSYSQDPPEGEYDPCVDPTVNCVRIWKPVG